MAQEFAELALVPIADARSSNDVGDRTATTVAARGAIAIGPGWFDSSWELHRGLEVQEGWPGDHGLRTWLDDFLAAQRAAGATASPSASTAMA
jgi:hypothetical protein